MKIGISAIALVASISAASASPTYYYNNGWGWYGVSFSHRVLHRHHASHHLRRHTAKVAVKPRRIKHEEVAGVSGGSKTLGSGKSSVGGNSRAPWIARMRAWIGGNPTGWAHNWCARAANLALELTGVRGTGDNRAISFARYGTPLSHPVAGAVAFGYHHVGFVLRDEGSRVLLLSGNYNHRVAIAHYPKSRLLGYRWPNVRTAELSPFSRVPQIKPF